MPLQYSVAVRNARLDAVARVVGPAPILELRSGSPPAACDAAPGGTLLAAGALPEIWMAPAAAGLKSKVGEWRLLGRAAGKIGHYRLVAAGICHEQGTVGADGVMRTDRAEIEPGQTVNVLVYTKTCGND